MNNLLEYPVPGRDCFSSNGRCGRPDLMAGRTSQTLYPGMSHLNENTVINVKNKSHVVTAQFSVPNGKASGSIIVQGGRFGGWGLYLKSGVPAHCYNYFGFEHVYARGTKALAPGKHTIRYVGEARLARTVPFIFSGDDFMDIGIDYGAPVTEDYKTPQGRFTGQIAWVRIDIGKDAFSDPAGMEEALAGRS